MKPFAMFLLGAWIAGTLFTFFVATQNFRIVDRILASPTPEATAPVRAIPHDTLRPVMRYQSSEMNRLYFWGWGVAQLLIGVVVVLLVTNNTDRILAGVMLLMVAGLFFYITPNITEIGRHMDFVPRNPLPDSYAPMMSTFWKLHGAYTGCELLKIVVGLVLAWRLRK